MNVIHCECGESIPIEGTMLDPSACPKCQRPLKASPGGSTSATQPVYGGSTTDLRRAPERPALDTHLDFPRHRPSSDRMRAVWGILGAILLVYFFLPKSGSLAWDSIRSKLGADPAAAAFEIAIGAAALALLALSAPPRSPARGIVALVLGLALQGLLGVSWFEQPGPAARLVPVAHDSVPAALLLALYLFSSLMLGADLARTKFIDDLRAARAGAAFGFLTLATGAALAATFPTLPGGFWSLGRIATISLSAIALLGGALLTFLNRRSHWDAADIARRALVMAVVGLAIPPCWSLLVSLGDAAPVFHAAASAVAGPLIAGLGLADHLSSASLARLHPG